MTKHTEASIARQAAALFAKTDTQRFALCKLIYTAQASESEGGHGLSLIKIAQSVGIERAALAHPDADAPTLAALSLDPSYRLSKTGAYNYAKAYKIVVDSGVEPTAELVAYGYRLANQSKVTSLMIKTLVEAVAAKPGDADLFVTLSRDALETAALNGAPATPDVPAAGEGSDDSEGRSDSEQLPIPASAEVIAQTLLEARTSVGSWTLADLAVVKSAMDALFDAIEARDTVNA